MQESLVQQFVSQYDSKIRQVSRRIFNNPSKLNYLYLKEEFYSLFKNAINTFYTDHTKTSAQNLTYFIGRTFQNGVANLSDQIKSNQWFMKPCCPLCRYLDKQIIYLKIESKRLKCSACLDKVTFYQNKLNDSIDPVTRFEIESQLELYRIFADHSKDGMRCPQCNNWTPHSVIQPNDTCLCCPYSKCNFFGEISQFRFNCVHPAAIFFKDSDNVEFLPEFLDNNPSCETPEVIIENNLQEQKYFNSIIQVINEQYNSIENISFNKTVIPKQCMYKAFESVLHLHKTEMINYLLFQQNTLNFPIQSIIFQEYIAILQEHMPFSFVENGLKYYVVDYLDPNLNLFDGISIFDSIITNEYTIKNETQEHFIGSKILKDYGPYFIGQLIDITDIQTNQSLINCVEKHSFSEIKLSPNDVVPGNKVRVEHFRVPSHYNIAHTMILQGVKSNISRKLTKIYKDQFAKVATQS